MIVINSFEELNEFIQDSTRKTKQIMLIFSASWCKPCKDLKERIVDIGMEDKKHLAIGLIDIDLNDDLAARFRIRSLPTQVFVEMNTSNTRVIEKHRIIGFDWNSLLSYLKY